MKYRSKKRNKLYANRYTKKNHHGIAIVLGIIFTICIVGVSGLGIHIYRLENNIKDTKILTDTIKAETKELDGQLSPLKESIDALKKEVNQLESMIWRYEPVIVPEKMK